MKVRHLIFLIFVWFAFPGPLDGQNEGNPFEIRVPVSHARDSIPAQEEAIDHSNPFEIKHVPENYFLRDTLTIKKPVPIVSRKVTNQNFLFVTVSLLMLFLTILVVLNRGLLANIYKAIFSDTYLKLVYRFQNNGQTLSYLLFYVFFFINAGLFLLLLLKHFKVQLFSSDIIQFFACVGAVMAIYIIKHIILRLIGLIFPVGKEVSYYNFTIIAFNIFLGIALFPINGLISFTSDNIANFALYTGMVVAILLYCIRQLRGMFLAGNFLTYQKFHFFIYLCTVEIAPILILAKIIISSVRNS